MTTRRALSGLLTALASATALLAAGAASASASTEVLVGEPFSGSTLSSSNWVEPSAPTGSNVACLTAGTSTSASPVPGCGLGTPDASGSGALRLTADSGSEEGGVGYSLSVPTVDGIDAKFDTYQYGTTSGADGIGFYLAAANPADPQPPASIGQPGGSLGYSATGSQSGMTYGYLGIGFDVYGNYANPQFQGSGCTNPSWATSGTRYPEEVTVRGPGNGSVGYCILNSTKTASSTMSGMLDQGASGTRSGSLVPVEVVINPTSSSVTTASGLTVAADSYDVAFTPIGASQQTLSGTLPNAASDLPTGWYDPTTGIPYQLTFGWVGSTGGDEDIHEVNQVQSATASGIPAILTDSVTDSANGTPAQDSTVEYDVNVGNEAGTSTDNSPITVTDTLPSGETPASTGLGGTGWTCSTSGQTVSCTNNGPLASGSALPQLVIPATVTASAGATLTNSLLTSSDDSDPTTGQETVTVATPPTNTSTCGTPNGANGWFISDPTCTVQGTDTNPGLDHVAYSLDGGSSVATSSGTTSASVQLTSDGAHHLSTTVYNGAGQSAVSTLTVDVDTTAPTDTTTCGTPSGQNGYFTTDPTCTVQGADATSGVDHVAYSLDGGGTVTTSSGTTAASVPITSDGAHTLTTTVYDAAGNVSATRTQTIKVLTAMPATPTVGTPANGSISNVTSPTVHVTGTPGDSATVQVDGVDYGPMTLDGSGNGQITLPGPLSDGQHAVRAEQANAAGTESAWSATSTWTVKTSTSVQLTGPTGGPTNVTTPTLDYSGEAGDSFTVTVDGQTIATGVIPNSGGGSLTLPSPLADGAHTIEITVTDAAGNQASQSIVVTVDTAAPGAPRIVTAPGAETASSSATFTFSDSKSPVAYQCSLNGAAWSTCSTPVTLTSLAQGPQTLLVRAIDQAGNVSASVQYAWTVITSAPPAPTILGGPDRYTLPASTSFNISSQPGTTLQCSLDGGAFQPCSTLVNLAALPIGPHSLAVRQVDEAGNVSPPAVENWTVLRRVGPHGLPRRASVLVSGQASADGDRALEVGCSLNAGSIKRCHVVALYRGVPVGEGTTVLARRGHSRTVVTVVLNARGQQLLRRALGGLPVRLAGTVEPFGFTVMPARTHAVVFAPLRVLLPNVLFDENSWHLTSSAWAIVRGIAAELRGARTVVCEGNTDDFGTTSYNQGLGLHRAQVVCMALRALGVHATMSTVSYADTRPVATNGTAAGRHLNRRVVVRVTYYDVPQRRQVRGHR